MNKHEILQKVEDLARTVQAKIQEDKRLLWVSGAVVGCVALGGLIAAALSPSGEDTVEPVSLASAEVSVSGAHEQTDRLDAARREAEEARRKAEASRRAAQEALRMAGRKAQIEDARIARMSSRLAEERRARSEAQEETERLNNRLAWLEDAMAAEAANQPASRTVYVENDGPSWWEYDSVVAQLEAAREYRSFAQEEKSAQETDRFARLMDALRTERESIEVLPVELHSWSRPPVYSPNYRPQGEASF